MMNMTERQRRTITQAIADLNTLLNKHDHYDPANMGWPTLTQHFGRLCRVMDVALIELGWDEAPSGKSVNKRMHERLDKRIAGCLSAMVRNIGPDLLTIECGILDTLSYSFKEQMLNEMREALK